MNAMLKRRMLQRQREALIAPPRFPAWLLVLIALGTAASLAVVVAIGTVFAVYQSYARDYVPIEDKLRQINVGLTEVYDRYGPESGVLLGSLSNPQADLLEPVALEDISKWVVEATISTEDNTFWEHQGVNLRGLMRAAYENYVVHEFGAGSGGSSITQQLVKNVYICPNVVTDAETERCVSAERTLDRKLREIAYAMELERDYTKQEILGWYLNQISYADRYVGIQAAAQGYFRKDAADLNLAEAALLAGIPASPHAYHPRENCVLVQGSDTECVVDDVGRTLVGGAAKQRQETVLDLMLLHGRATAEEVAEARAYDLRVYPVTKEMRAPAFIDDQVEPQLVRLCERGVLPVIPGADDCETSVHSAGYQVTSTLDWVETQRATQIIESEVARGLEAGCNCHNAAVVTIEPSTGQVIVYAPNVDPDNVDDPRIAGNIDQLAEINQPGSSFKPAVYLAWFDYLNKTPMSFIWDTSPLVIGDEPGDDEPETEIVNPRAGSFKSEGLISARAALGGSQNVPAFRAAAEAGIDKVIEMAKRLGITTLHQGFDPTFRAHPDVTYGASIATGGANIKAIDMAYMFSVIANMGVMVGVPHGATYVDPSEFRSLALAEGSEYETAIRQRDAFMRGHLRLPGTRELDPVVVLEVRDYRGNVIYTHTEPERLQVVDAGSVWLLHSIMSDCKARFIIWGCGSSNSDLALDFHLDDVKVPSGVKTGTQQGPLAAADTLETWMNGYTRYAATAVWVGNANNELVRDGPAAGYAAAHTTLWLFKNWMAEYHRYARDERGLFTTPAGFEDLMPANVTWGRFKSPITDRGYGGGCNQYVDSWQRNDVQYPDPCVNGYVPLPDFEPEAAQKLARSGAKYIPVRGGWRSSQDDGGDNGANGNGGNGGGNHANNGNNGHGGGNGVAHPRAFEECVSGCTDRPLRIICGPGGWFIDHRSDYPNVRGWPEGQMTGNEDFGTAVRRICG